MCVRVTFYSYFKELAGCAKLEQDLPERATLGQLVEQLGTRYPRLGAMQKSMLMAVGVEYQTRDYVLQAGDQVSLFPPVQGG